MVSYSTVVLCSTGYGWVDYYVKESFVVSCDNLKNGQIEKMQKLQKIYEFSEVKGSQNS